MKNLKIEILWQFLSMSLFFNRGKAKKICKAGQVNYRSQNFHVAARSKFIILQIPMRLKIIIIYQVYH